MARNPTESLAGQHVELVPLTRLDYDFLFRLEAMGPLATSYRFRGMTPSPEKFPEKVWQGVIAQFVMVWKSDQKRIGSVMCYGADYRNRYARIGGALVPDAPSPYALEGFALFLDYVFAEFDFRKLYGETLECLSGCFASAIGPLIHEEGRLRGHEYFHGDYEDVLMFAIYADEWKSLRSSQYDSSKMNQADVRLRSLSRAVDGASESCSLANRLRGAVGAGGSRVKEYAR